MKIWNKRTRGSRWDQKVQHQSIEREMIHKETKAQRCTNTDSASLTRGEANSHSLATNFTHTHTHLLPLSLSLFEIPLTSLSLNPKVRFSYDLHLINELIHFSLLSQSQNYRAFHFPSFSLLIPPLSSSSSFWCSSMLQFLSD